jgi:protein O-mannosyl-transferase
VGSSLSLRLQAWWPAALVAAVAIAASVSGLGNGFAYDDVHLVLRNGAVHSLAGLPGHLLEPYWPAIPLGPGGRLYRPLTVIAFALEWAMGGGRPLAFHVLSVTLYTAVALLVLALARRLLSRNAAVVAAGLFAAHPVHVEAVANVVGQGELLAAIPLLVGVSLYLDGRREGFSPGRTALIAGTYLLGCLAKEHAVLLPLILAAVELGLGPHGRRLEESARLLLWLTLVGVVYLSVRSAVVHGVAGDLPHPLWRGASFASRLWTMLGLVPRGLGLLLWPAHLQADYSPAEITLATGPGPAQWIGLGLLLGIVVLTLLAWRSIPVLAVGTGWVAISLAPVSNILQPTGIILAERTLFLASVGVVLALGGALDALLLRRPTWSRWLLAGAGVVTVLGVVASARRQPVWRDNTTLFGRTVVDAPRCYWAWRNWAGDLVLRQRPDSAAEAYRRSLQLFDRDPQVYDDFASFNRRTGHCDAAVPLFRRSLELDPARDQTAARLIGCLVTLRRYAEARAEATARIERGTEEFRNLRALVDSAERSQ